MTDADEKHPVYQFSVVDHTIINQLEHYRYCLDSVTAEETDFAEPPFDAPDGNFDLQKLESQHDPHRGPERQFDYTLSTLIDLAGDHRDTDFSITESEIDLFDKLSQRIQSDMALSD